MAVIWLWTVLAILLDGEGGFGGYNENASIVNKSLQIQEAHQQNWLRSTVWVITPVQGSIFWRFQRRPLATIIWRWCIVAYSLSKVAPKDRRGGAFHCENWKIIYKQSAWKLVWQFMKWFTFLTCAPPNLFLLVMFMNGIAKGMLDKDHIQARSIRFLFVSWCCKLCP